MLVAVLCLPSALYAGSGDESGTDRPNVLDSDPRPAISEVLRTVEAIPCLLFHSHE
jgi:hypothetical protein